LLYVSNKCIDMIVVVRVIILTKPLFDHSYQLWPHFSVCSLTNCFSKLFRAIFLAEEERLQWARLKQMRQLQES